MKNSLTYSIKFIVVNIIGDFLYFPIWWYSRGTKIATNWWLKKINQTDQKLFLLLWIRHLFSPMYGVHDIWGRLISFIVRFVILIFRSLIFILLFIIYSIILLFYFLILPFVIIMFIRSLT